MLNNKTQNKKLFLLKEVMWLLPVIVFATFIITLSAKTKVPFYPVPITMQTFVIMAIGVAFGKRVGLLILLTYFFRRLIWSSSICWHSRKRCWIKLYTWTNLRILNGIFYYCISFWKYQR